MILILMTIIIRMILIFHDDKEYDDKCYDDDHDGYDVGKREAVNDILNTQSQTVLSI